MEIAMPRKLPPNVERNQVKGHIEEGVGRVTGDEETEARGVADRRECRPDFSL